MVPTKPTSARHYSKYTQDRVGKAIVHMELEQCADLSKLTVQIAWQCMLVFLSRL